jgi:hypothetical protein
MCAKTNFVPRVSMRVELDHSDSQRRDASHFVERRLIVIGVDRCDRKHLRIFCRKSDQFIVLAPSLRHLAAFCDQDTREPSHSLVGLLQLCFVCAHRCLAIPNVDVRIEHSLRATARGLREFLRPSVCRGERHEEAEQERAKNH